MEPLGTPPPKDGQAPARDSFPAAGLMSLWSRGTACLAAVPSSPPTCRALRPLPVLPRGSLCRDDRGLSDSHLLAGPTADIAPCSLTGVDPSVLAQSHGPAGRPAPPLNLVRRTPPPPAVRRGRRTDPLVSVLVTGGIAGPAAPWGSRCFSGLLQRSLLEPWGTAQLPPGPEQFRGTVNWDPPSPSPWGGDGTLTLHLPPSC